MPWAVSDVMDQRLRFVVEATREGAKLAAVCRQFGISRTTGHFWLRRYQQEGVAGLFDRSRRPHHSPTRTAPAIEDLVLGHHQAFGEGAKKVAYYLRQDDGIDLPVITVHRILKRHGKVGKAKESTVATRRFERSAPNALWQMDFKGHLTQAGARCYPLSILDDHSRYVVGLHALKSLDGPSTFGAIKQTFLAHGLPEAMLMDHGTPWWSTTNGYGLTWVSVALIKQGIRLHWSGIGHPQTQGKVERFHRSLKAALSHRGGVSCWDQWQREFDAFRTHYNNQRPHEALGMQPPASRYASSPRAYDPDPPAWDYPEGARVRRLNAQGCLSWQGRYYFVCEAMRHERVAIWELDGKLLVQFRQLFVREVDLRRRTTTAVVVPVAETPINHDPKCKPCPDNDL